MFRSSRGTVADVSLIIFIFFMIFALYYGKTIYTQSLYILKDKKYNIPFIFGFGGTVFGIICKVFDMFSCMSTFCKKLSSSIISLVILPVLAFLFSTGYLISFFIVTDANDMFGIKLCNIWFGFVLIANISSIICMIYSSLQYLKSAKWCLSI